MTSPKYESALVIVYGFGSFCDQKIRNFLLYFRIMCIIVKQA